MKKIIALSWIALLGLSAINCSNDNNSNTKTDTASLKTDTVQSKILTEGGLKDSVRTGASDSAANKSSRK